MRWNMHKGHGKSGMDYTVGQLCSLYRSVCTIMARNAKVWCICSQCGETKTMINGRLKIGRMVDAKTRRKYEEKDDKEDDADAVPNKRRWIFNSPEREAAPQNHAQISKFQQQIARSNSTYKFRYYIARVVICSHREDDMHCCSVVALQKGSQSDRHGPQDFSGHPVCGFWALLHSLFFHMELYCWFPSWTSLAMFELHTRHILLSRHSIAHLVVWVASRSIPRRQCPKSACGGPLRNPIHATQSYGRNRGWVRGWNQFHAVSTQVRICMNGYSFSCHVLLLMTHFKAHTDTPQPIS